MADDDDKKAYLDYYKKTKSKKGKPATYAAWSKDRKQGQGADKAGMTGTNRRQMASLSSDDYEEISKMLKKKDD